MGKRGPAPKPESEHRNTRVSVYFSDDELAALDRRRGGRSRGQWLREAGLGELPALVPELNRQAWADLSRVAGLLKRYIVAIEVGNAKGMPPSVVTELRDHVQQLRNELLGINPFDDDVDDDAESAENEVW